MKEFYYWLGTPGGALAYFGVACAAIAVGILWYWLGGK